MAIVSVLDYIRKGPPEIQELRKYKTRYYRSNYCEPKKRKLRYARLSVINECAALIPECGVKERVSPVVMGLIYDYLKNGWLCPKGVKVHRSKIESFQKKTIENSVYIVMNDIYSDFGEFSPTVIKRAIRALQECGAIQYNIVYPYRRDLNYSNLRLEENSYAVLEYRVNADHPLFKINDRHSRVYDRSNAQCLEKLVKDKLNKSVNGIYLSMVYYFFIFYAANKKRDTYVFLNTYEQLHKRFFPFIHPKTLGKYIRILDELGLIQKELVPLDKIRKLVRITIHTIESFLTAFKNDVYVYYRLITKKESWEQIGKRVKSWAIGYLLNDWDLHEKPPEKESLKPGYLWFYSTNSKVVCNSGAIS